LRRAAKQLFFSFRFAPQQVQKKVSSPLSLIYTSCRRQLALHSHKNTYLRERQKSFFRHSLFFLPFDLSVNPAKPQYAKPVRKQPPSSTLKIERSWGKKLNFSQSPEEEDGHVYELSLRLCAG
jgi:hypothetical protein